jgi:hypothetical protein
MVALVCTPLGDAIRMNRQRERGSGDQKWIAASRSAFVPPLMSSFQPVDLARPRR